MKPQPTGELAGPGRSVALSCPPFRMNICMTAFWWKCSILDFAFVIGNEANLLAVRRRVVERTVSDSFGNLRAARVIPHGFRWEMH